MTDLEWLGICDLAENDYPEIKRFINEFGPKDAMNRLGFRSHLVKLIMKVNAKAKKEQALTDNMMEEIDSCLTTWSEDIMKNK